MVKNLVKIMVFSLTVMTVYNDQGKIKHRSMAVALWVYCDMPIWI